MFESKKRFQTFDKIPAKAGEGVDLEEDSILLKNNQEKICKKFL
jgi:hypothetical protein